MRRWLIPLLTALALPAQAEMYSDRLLAQTARSWGPNISAMVAEDIIATLPRAERLRAGRIQVRLLGRGRHPLDIFADPRAEVIYVPMSSVRFFDDLAILQAWFTARNCDQIPIQQYLWALLRDGRDLPAPLNAFGLDRAALLADPFTDDVSAKVLKSGMFFILAHEVGHVMLSHQGGAKGPFSQSQETEADAFAMARFAEIGSYPGGAALFFLAARWLDPVGTATLNHSHPVAPDRLRAIAETLAADPERYAFSEPDRAQGEDAVRSIAAELEKIAALASDDGLLTILPIAFRDGFAPETLPEACPI